MLRSAILTKIKRAIGTPRLLQSGDLMQALSPPAGGKFERPLYGVQSSVSKSSTSDEGRTQKPVDVPLKEDASQETIKADTQEKEPKEIETKETVPKQVEISNTNTNEDIWALIRSKLKPRTQHEEEIHNEECKRIINNIFGDEETPQDKTGVKKMEKSHEHLCNISDESSNTLQDERIRRRMCDNTELCLMNDKSDEGTSLRNDNFRSILCYDAVIIKDNDKKTSGKEKKQSSKNNSHNIYDDHESISVDPHWRDAYKSFQEKSVIFDSEKAIDIDTIKLYKRIKSQEPLDKCENKLESKRIKLTEEEMAKILFGNPYEHDFIQHNTATQDDEKLAQKIEHIDETPLVEASNPKIDTGHNQQKILGNSEKLVSNAVNTLSTKEMHTSVIQHGAKQSVERVTDADSELRTKPASTGQHSILTKDSKATSFIEAGNPQKLPASNLAAQSVDDEQSKFLKKFENMQQNFFNSNKLDRNNIDLSVTKKTAAGHPQTKPGSTDRNSNITDKITIAGDLIPISSDQKAIKTGEVDYSNINLIPIPNKDDLCKTETGETVPEPVFNVHMDPKHVLTCNETCAISPHPLIINSHKQITNNKLNSLIDEPSLGKYDTQGENQRSLAEVLETGNLQEKVENPTIEHNTATNTDYDTSSNSIDSLLEKHKQNFFETNNIIPRRQYDEDQDKQMLDSLYKNILDTNQLLQETTERINQTSFKLLNTTEILEAATKELLASSEELIATTNKKNEINENSYGKKERKPLLENEDNIDEQGLDMGPETEYTSERPYGVSYNFLPTYSHHTTPQHHPKKESNLTSSSATEEKHSKKESISSNLFVNSSATVEKLIDLYDKPESKAVKNTRAPGKKETDIESEEINFPRRNMPDIKPDELSQQTPKLSPSLSTVPETKPLPQPKVNENMKLSEILQLVRERNRLLNVYENLSPESKKSIPPLSQPRHETKVYQTTTYTKTKPMPKICVTKKNNPKSKCIRCDLKVLGLDDDLHRHKAPNFPGIGGNFDETSDEVTVISDVPNSADLTEELMLQLQSIGDDLRAVYDCRKREVLEAAVLTKSIYQNHLSNNTIRLNRSKDFDPWNAIPSWPYWKKYERPKLQTPQQGCKFPAPSPQECMPGGLRPCKTFPTFPKRVFSMLDFMTVSLDDHNLENRPSDSY